MNETGTRSEYPGLPDRLFALLLYLLPHHLLSSAMYWLTRSRWFPLKNLMIRSAIRIYRVDMGIAEEPDPEHYPSFNAFFTRALRPGARPVTRGRASIASPVDGTLSQAGTIRQGRIIQAKGQYYSARELLGGDPRLAEHYDEGHFATIYLSPRDYHRIHMPFGGVLKQMIHVPGRLFSVSPSTTRAVPCLFSRNERVISLFETGFGPMAVVMVGAIFVASMDTAWAGTVAPLARRISHWDYSGTPPEPVELEKGEEMGRFNMGSTVILLFPAGKVTWSENLRPGTPLKMGEQIGAFQIPQP
ncbi:MAG TPA: phosphatidylserine decarboxylase [Sedimenticola sp.]|nr:phosphatidylserine decarboxylase [Sedimenticola sp.]